MVCLWRKTWPFEPWFPNGNPSVAGREPRREIPKRKKQPSDRLLTRRSGACNRAAFRVIRSPSLRAQSPSALSQMMILGSQHLLPSHPREPLDSKDKNHVGDFQTARPLQQAILNRPLFQEGANHRMLSCLLSLALPSHRPLGKRIDPGENMDQQFRLPGPIAMARRMERTEVDHPTSPHHRGLFRLFKSTKAGSHHKFLRALYPSLPRLLRTTTTLLLYQVRIITSPRPLLPMEGLVNFSCRFPNIWVRRYDLPHPQQSWSMA